MVDKNNTDKPELETMASDHVLDEAMGNDERQVARDARRKRERDLYRRISAAIEGNSGMTNDEKTDLKLEYIAVEQEYNADTLKYVQSRLALIKERDSANNERYDALQKLDKSNKELEKLRGKNAGDSMNAKLDEERRSSSMELSDSKIGFFESQRTLLVLIVIWAFLTLINFISTFINRIHFINNR